jgi:hypothetical protein
MNEILDLTPGLQCCLRCGRMLTNRALHDAFEEPALASMRAGRVVGGDKISVDGAATECRPCIEEYRNFLSKRQARAERPAEESGASRLPWVEKWLGKRVAAAVAARAF